MNNENIILLKKTESEYNKNKDDIEKKIEDYIKDSSEAGDSEGLQKDVQCDENELFHSMELDDYDSIDQMTNQSSLDDTVQRFNATLDTRDDYINNYLIGLYENCNSKSFDKPEIMNAFYKEFNLFNMLKYKIFKKTELPNIENFYENYNVLSKDDDLLKEQRFSLIDEFLVMIKGVYYNMVSDEKLSFSARLSFDSSLKSFFNTLYVYLVISEKELSKYEKRALLRSRKDAAFCLLSKHFDNIDEFYYQSKWMDFQLLNNLLEYGNSKSLFPQRELSDEMIQKMKKDFFIKKEVNALQNEIFENLSYKKMTEFDFIKMTLKHFNRIISNDETKVDIIKKIEMF